MVSAISENSRFVDYINHNFYIIKGILKGRVTVSFWRGTPGAFFSDLRGGGKK
jgi:hypothetical protein